MDDYDLWAAMQKGEPVAHCRAKIEYERRSLIERRNKAGRRARERRSYRLRHA